MSRSLGRAPPAEPRRRLSQSDLGPLLGRGLPFVTLSDDGSLHPMLCSYLEWLALDERALRPVIAGGRRSARGLEGGGAAARLERGEGSVGPLRLVEPDRTVYVKCRAAGAPLRVADLARFTLAVDDVLADSPGPGGGGGGGGRGACGARGARPARGGRRAGGFSRADGRGCADRERDPVRTGSRDGRRAGAGGAGGVGDGRGAREPARPPPPPTGP